MWRVKDCPDMVLIIDGFEVEGALPVSQLFDKWQNNFSIINWHSFCWRQSAAIRMHHWRVNMLQGLQRSVAQVPAVEGELSVGGWSSRKKGGGQWALPLCSTERGLTVISMQKCRGVMPFLGGCHCARGWYENIGEWGCYNLPYCRSQVRSTSTKQEVLTAFHLQGLEHWSDRAGALGQRWTRGLPHARERGLLPTYLVHIC